MVVLIGHDRIAVNPSPLRGEGFAGVAWRMRHARETADPLYGPRALQGLGRGWHLDELEFPPARRRETGFREALLRAVERLRRMQAAKGNCFQSRRDCVSGSWTVASLGAHPNGTIQPYHGAIQHFILNNMLGQRRIFLRRPEPRREGHLRT